MEWALDAYRATKGNKYVLSTGFSDSEAPNANIFGNDQFDKIFQLHSHSRENGTKGGSGDYGSYYKGDMAAIVQEYNIFKAAGKTLPPHFVYHKYSQTLFKYTPWNSSITIKKITNPSDFNLNILK